VMVSPSVVTASPPTATGSLTNRSSQLPIRTNSREAIGPLNWPGRSVASPVGTDLERATRLRARDGKVRWPIGNVR
jgi:SMC interacting uncharacterized protein involved in chromosome segregation